MRHLGRLGRVRTFSIPHVCESYTFLIYLMYVSMRTHVKGRQNVLNVLTRPKSPVPDRS